MLTVDPNSRAYVDDCLEHPYLSGWEKFLVGCRYVKNLQEYDNPPDIQELLAMYDNGIETEERSLQQWKGGWILQAKVHQM